MASFIHERDVWRQGIVSSSMACDEEAFHVDFSKKLPSKRGAGRKAAAPRRDMANRKFGLKLEALEPRLLLATTPIDFGQLDSMGFAASAF